MPPFRSLRAARIPGQPPVAALLAMALLAGHLGFSSPALAEEEPNGATIQWAQQILDDQGFYQGRAHGRLDSATVAAVTAYQRKNGLKATGKLDRATVARLMEGREPPKGVGNLADPNSRARSSGPMLREQDVKPQAAPAAAGVERGEGGEQSILPAPGAAPVPVPAPARSSVPQVAGGAATPAPAASPAARADQAAGTGQPTAAPREAVTVDGTAADDGGFDIEEFVPMNVVRYGLLGLVGALVLGLAFAFWNSGRRRGPARKAAGTKPRRAAPPPAAVPERRPPSLGKDQQGDRSGGLRATRH